MTKFRARRGFTLVEVLVVLGVLICLIGILLPALVHMREQSRRVQCVSHLRQLTSAWLTYATDNDRYICSAQSETQMSGAPNWIGTSYLIGRPRLEAGILWSYLNNEVVYRCPADSTTNASSYQINGVLQGKVGIPFFPIRRLDELTNAAKTFVFIEGCRNNSNKPLPNEQLENGFLTPIYPQNSFKRLGFPGENHKDAGAAAVGTGISFADGHAMYWPYADKRTGTIQEDLFAGIVKTDAAPNSPDVFQLEAWSGGSVPKGAVQ